MHGLELLKKGAIWRIGDGKRVKLWRHCWIPRDYSLRLVGKRHPCRLKWVADLIDEDNHCWKGKEVLSHYFHHHYVAEILKIKIPREGEDIVAWHPERSGNFTVRSAYRLGVTL